jgi:ribulose-5-phosphate 4-epimerase/fuculose-1-phosphate aldolase
MLPMFTAWYLHGALHRKVPEARCIMHVHSKFATVLASLADSSMPPIDQNTMRFYGKIAVDDGYDGMGLSDEAERVATLMQSNAGKSVLIMGNHGVMIFAPTVAYAFDEMYYFERSAETLITAYMTGKPLRVASHGVAQKTADQWREYPGIGDLHFAELKSILDDEGSDFRK